MADPYEKLIKAINDVAKSIEKLAGRIRNLENRDTITIVYKTTAGDYANPTEGMHVINTIDNTYKVYADGAWRTLSSW